MIDMKHPSVFIKIADRPLAVECRYPATAERLAGFEMAAVPDALPIRVSPADRAAERERVGTAPSEAYVESLAVERAVADALAPYGVIHMHAVALAVTYDGRREACVFLAESGEGKSTHARRWLEYIGDAAAVVADDKPFLSFAGNTLLVHGSPWRGKEGMGENLSVPVRCFCILRRGEEDAVRRADAAEAMREMLSRTRLPEEPEGAAAVLAVVDKVLMTMPFWHLCCTNSLHAAEVAYHALFDTIERK